jgi:hypothetical protein
MTMLRKFSPVLVVALFLLGVMVGRSVQSKPVINGQKYYCKVFRLASVRDTVLAVPTWSSQGQEQIFSDSILNGYVGELDSSSIMIRFVAIWDTNNKDYLTRDTFSVALEQRHNGAVTDTILFDSLAVTYVPGSENHVLVRGRTSGSVGKNESDMRVRTNFGNVIVPDGIDTVRVRFIGTVNGQGTVERSHKFFDFLMVRYEGMARRHDWRPKD